MEITGDHLIERVFTLSDGLDWVYELEYVRGTKLVIVLSGAGLVLVEDDGNRVISPQSVILTSVTTLKELDMLLELLTKNKS
jgi:hypothetical protein